MSNMGFFVYSISSSFYSTFIQWGIDRNLAIFSTIVCGLGIVIGGISFFMEKIKNILPKIPDIISGRKGKRGWAFLLIVITMASAGINYMLSSDTMSTGLAILSTIIFTIVMSLAAIDGLYANKEEKNKAEKGDFAKMVHRFKKRKSVIGKVMYIGCLGVGAVNLSISSLSGAAGWVNKLSLDKAALYAIFFSATVLVGYNRFYFSHFVDNTLKIDDDIHTTGENIEHGVESITDRFNLCTSS